MFIRSANKPNAESLRRPNMSQPYTKFFVLDFEATCDNGAHLLKPQVYFNFNQVTVALDLIIILSKEKIMDIINFNYNWTLNYV